ncbi:MAG TPA: universal stress protein [Dehalococcoidia bacterium]|nr:universal stress protein [Dehalococcoidia bacterium]
MLKKILVSLDGSTTSEAILPAVEKMVGPDTEITLITVAAPPQGVVPEVRPLYVAGVPAPGGVREMPPLKPVETKDQAFAYVTGEETDYLEAIARVLRGTGAKVTTHVAFGDAAEEIESHAREAGVDLIMMATHGRTALSEVVFGSVAAHVLRSGVCPVLLVRPHDLA